MKKYKLILAIIVISFSNLFISCEKNDPIENQNEITPNEFNYVGVEHNQGLSYIYDELNTFVTTKSEKSLSIDNLFDLVKTYANGFYLNSQATQALLSKSTEISEAQIEATLAYYKTQSEQEIDNSSFIDSCLTYGNISQAQKSLLFELLNGMDTAEDLDDIIALVDYINTEAANTFSDPVDLVIIYCATSVAKNSSEYWLLHLNDWVDMFDQNTTKEDSDWDWRSTAKSDVTGAVGGAVGGAIAGAAAGGVGALPGAGIGAVAGAVGGSAADAVGQLFEKIFK